jgi:NAD-dependent oxidoreductase involved in siderophore biosynthesis
VAICKQFETACVRANQLLAQQREKFGSDNAFRAEMKRAPKGPVIQAPTRYVADEIRRSLIRDATAPMTTNDWADFFHTIVAVSYCDFVILDRRWFAAATQAQRRLKKAGLLEDVHFARVFSVGKLTDFWAEFDV